MRPRRHAERRRDRQTLWAILKSQAASSSGTTPRLIAAEGVQERALDRVLGLLARAELVQAVAEDLVRVLLVERARHVRLGGKRPFDAAGTTYGRNCGQILFPVEDGRAPPEHA